MIEKSITLSHPVDPELLERLRFYLPYLCDPILSLEIVSGARLKSVTPARRKVVVSLSRRWPTRCWANTKRADSEHLNPASRARRLRQSHGSLFLQPRHPPRTAERGPPDRLRPRSIRHGKPVPQNFKYFERECARMTLKQKPAGVCLSQPDSPDLMEHSDYANDQAGDIPGSPRRRPGDSISPRRFGGNARASGQTGGLSTLLPSFQTENDRRAGHDHHSGPVLPL